MPHMSEPAHRAQVLPATAVRVSSGANLGDSLQDWHEACLGDTYRFEGHPPMQVLAMRAPTTAATAQMVAQGSQIGQAGAGLRICTQLRLMALDGQKLDLLVLHVEGAGQYILPLGALAPKRDYTLLSITTPDPDLRLTDVICLSFHRGTRIALASGAMVPIETLTPGTRILTRDHGPQPIRWIGRTTLRAQGAFAPVVITKGAMENEADLVVGPHHRLFVYRRDHLPGLPRAELLVQAQHLVDDETIYRREGGFAEYFSLVFDNHEILYAEGIPVESLMVNDDSLAALPKDLAADLRRDLPDLRQTPHIGLEPKPEQAKALHKRRALS